MEKEAVLLAAGKYIWGKKKKDLWKCNSRVTLSAVYSQLLTWMRLGDLVKKQSPSQASVCMEERALCRVCSGVWG